MIRHQEYSLIEYIVGKVRLALHVCVFLFCSVCVKLPALC